MTKIQKLHYKLDEDLCKKGVEELLKRQINIVATSVPLYSGNGAFLAGQRFIELYALAGRVGIDENRKQEYLLMYNKIVGNYFSDLKHKHE
jgi:hypothetical protein